MEVNKEGQLAKEENMMTKELAMTILMGDGWNKNGAKEIIRQLEDDKMLDETTKESLLTISDDYKDR